MPEGSRLATVERFAMTATDPKLSVVESLFKFATLRGHTMVELAVSWLASNHLVSSVIAGATSPGTSENKRVAAKWELTDQDLPRLTRSCRNHRSMEQC